MVEKAKSVAVVPYDGEWKDLGTWNVLTDELKERCIGNVVMDEKSENTHVINELEIPVMCIGAKDMVIAASWRWHPGFREREERAHQDICGPLAMPPDVRGASLGRI